MDARGGGRRVGPARSLPVLVVVTVLAAGGCRGAGETTDKMVPRGWRGNPWGPAANAARARGEIPVVPNNPEMDRLGSRGGGRTSATATSSSGWAMPGPPSDSSRFSKISAAIAASRYSHTGIVAVEGG